MLKDDKKTQNREWLPARIILAIFVTAFIMYGFFIKQPCDTDQQYLWCRLHPASLLQIIGVIFIVAGAVVLSGLIKWLKLWNEANSSKWNYMFCAILAIGFLLAWFG